MRNSSRNFGVVRLFFIFMSFGLTFFYCIDVPGDEIP